MSVRACARVRVCMNACVRACMRVCVHACNKFFIRNKKD